MENNQQAQAEADKELLANWLELFQKGLHSGIAVNLSGELVTITKFINDLLAAAKRETIQKCIEMIENHQKNFKGVYEASCHELDLLGVYMTAQSEIDGMKHDILNSNSND